MSNDQIISIFSKPNRYVVGSTAILALVLVSIGLLIANRGINYADYNLTYTIQFADEIDTDVLDSFSGSEYVSVVDRDAKTIDLQGLSQEEINKRVEELEEVYGEEHVSVSSSNRILPADLVSRIGFAVVVSVIVFLGFGYYTIWRVPPRHNVRAVLRSLGLYGAVLFIGVVIHLGLLSGISLVYELRDMSFAGLIISGFIGLVLIYILQHQVLEREGQGESLATRIAADEEWLGSVTRDIMGVSLTVLGFLTLGMGSQFLVDAALLWLGIGVVVYSIKYLPSFAIDLGRGAFRRSDYAVVEKDPNPKIVGDEYIDIEEVNKTGNFSGISKKKRKVSKKKRRV